MKGEPGGEGGGGIVILWRQVLLEMLVRAIRIWPINRGAEFMLRNVIRRLVPEDDYVSYRVGDDVEVELPAREKPGLVVRVYGSFEAGELDWVRRRLNSGDWALDVGANVGAFTVAMATSVGPSGKVVALEPDPQNLRWLRENVRRNGLEHQVSVVPAAATERDGEEILMSVGQDRSFTQVTDRPDDAFTASGRSLDSIWMSADRPDVTLMKLDVEGHELPALRGAAGLLESCRPHLLLEASRSWERKKITDFLGRFGYRQVGISELADRSCVFEA